MARRPVFEIVNGWPVVDIGRLRHWITILQPGFPSPQTYDAAGPQTQLTSFTTAMASIETVRGMDVIKSGQTTTQLFLEVVMLYQPGILADMQVQSDNGSKYLVQSVENILELNVVLVLNCIGLGANQ